MSRVGLYLSGAGSLDGSDVFCAVLSYWLLQRHGHEPIPLGRDVRQGEVMNHRLARREETSRNALDEAARVVRGNVHDLRDVEAGSLEGAVLVGGGGSLSTWTDYHERGSDLRVTERLKFHLLELYRQDRAIVCLDNAVLPVTFVLRDSAERLTVNPGDGPVSDLLASWEVVLSSETPCWDPTHRVGSQPGLLQENHLPTLRQRLETVFSRAELT